MKVGTDGCYSALTGATGATRRVLDIGSGSGLIARCWRSARRQVTVDAVELDEAAAGGRENAAESPWPGGSACMRRIFTIMRSSMPLSMI